MLFDWMGEENFKKGTSAYLKKFAYQACYTEQLWSSFEEQISDESYPVLKVGQYWTDVQNFPVLSVELTNATELVISQTCVLETENLWPLPVHLTINGKHEKFLLESKSKTVSIPENAVVNANFGGYSFTRVRYSDELLNRLVKELPNMSKYDQLQIQSDVFFECTKGYRLFKDYLELIFNNYSEIKHTQIVVSQILDNFEKILPILRANGNAESMNAKIEEFLLKIFAKIGWNEQEGEELDNELLRPVLLSWLVGLKNKDVLCHGTDLYKSGGYSSKIQRIVYD